MFKPADIILAVALIIIGFGFSFFLSVGKDEGSQINVTIDGKPYGVYSLAENQTVKIKQEDSVNVIEIKDGSAFMKSANCKGQDCVHEGSISMTHEKIVCLPHKIVVEVAGGEEEFDAIAK